MDDQDGHKTSVSALICEIRVSKFHRMNKSVSVLWLTARKVFTG